MYKAWTSLVQTREHSGFHRLAWGTSMQAKAQFYDNQADTANVFEMPCCLWFFVVPQLHSLLPSVFGWPDPAVTWPGQKAMRKLTPEEKMCCSLLFQLLYWRILTSYECQHPGGKRTGVTHGDDDEVKGCSFWWWFALGMMSVYAQKPRGFPCHLLTSEEDLAITGNI